MQPANSQNIKQTDHANSRHQVEQGSKNHEVVPTPLIAQIAGLRGGSGVHRNISNLAKVDLIAKVKNARCMYS